MTVLGEHFRPGDFLGSFSLDGVPGFTLGDFIFPGDGVLLFAAGVFLGEGVLLVDPALEETFFLGLEAFRFSELDFSEGSSCEVKKFDSE